MAMSESFQREVDAPIRALRHLVQGVPRGLWVALAAAAGLAAVYGMSLALRPPGLEIRSELAAAAAELHAQLFVRATPEMGAAIREHFGDRDVDIDMTSQWPNVAATLHHVDWDVCVDAVRAARRIEGPVVIDLEAYRSPKDCRASNDMTWLIRP